MATSSASVKLKRLRQRFGISAPRVSVRTYVPWYLRVLVAVLVLSLSLALAAWIYNAGRRFAGFDSGESTREIQSLRNYVMELDAELTKLRGVAGSGESRLQIEQAALRQLSSQVKSLELENASLKQDLAFFEELMPSVELGGGQLGLRINQFRIESGAKLGEFRYRMLVVNNGGRQVKEARGSLQLVLEVRQGGGDAMIVVPSDGERNSPRFRFEVKHFYRLEGGFSVPDGVVVKRVEARLLQDGVIRAKQFVSL